MTNKFSTSLLPALCLLLLFCHSSTAQVTETAATSIPGLTAKGKRAFKAVPDFTKGDKKDDKHDWNLGPTGARGWMWGMRLRTDLARQILITKVDKDSPADGILKVGDVILGVDGKSFDHDARIALGNAITEAELPENKGTLNLTRWRDGKTETVALKIGVMGAYSKQSPFGCEKSKQIVDKACKYIIKSGLKNHITGYVNALGLLSTGNEEYIPVVRKFARSLRMEDAGGLSSWTVGYMNIFLSEYYLLTGDEEVLPEIKKMALFFANGQSRVGTWGHGNALENGILGGYGAMCQPSLSVAVSLLLNQKCGINDPAIAEAIRKTSVFFSTFVNKGNICYGDGVPRTVHDSNGRSSLAVIFYNFLNKKDAYNYFARMTIASYAQREEGHTGNYWSFLWGPLGALRAGPEACAAFLKEQRWFFELERRWDGGFTYQGGAAMSGSEHTTPGWDTTGARILMYTLPLKKLYITGKDQPITNPLTGQALEDTMDAGRHYSVWLRENYINIDALDKLSKEELLKKLVTWSTPLRIRAAEALARKKDDMVPAFMTMLESNDRNTILGGIYGLESQKEKAVPAIDKLVALLKHDDLWIRFRAGCALCAIGEPARKKAAPVLLKLALEDVPGDEREINQLFITFVLWGAGNNGAPRGLLRKGIEEVDKELLIPAIQRLIRNENGQSRAYVAVALKEMPPEMLNDIWDDVIWGVRNAAPSAIMFNAVIQETGIDLLAKYRYKEAIPVCAEYIRHMKQHGSQKRIYRIMKILHSYGAEAKSALPALYKAREYYQANLGPDKKLRFPKWATDEFFKGLNEGIKKIEEATETPDDLRTLKQ